MPSGNSNDRVINPNNAFTELFNGLVKYKDNNGDLSLDYSPRAMSKMLLYTDNASTSILQGLQGLGKIMAASSIMDKEDIMHVGFFLTILGNLLEALNSLRMDFENELSGVMCVKNTNWPTTLSISNNENN